jgi:heavy metal sensor kinase
VRLPGLLRSVRWRLTLWYALALEAVLVLYGLAIFSAMYWVLESRLDADIRQENNVLAAKLDHEFGEGEEINHACESLVRKNPFHDIFLEIYGPTGNLMNETAHVSETHLSRGLDFDTVPGFRDPALRFTFYDEVFDPSGMEVAASRVVHASTGESYFIVTAKGRASMMWSLTMLAVLMVALIPLLVLLAAASGALLARRALDPVVDMAAQARRMGTDRLSIRLAVPNPHDEMGQLADTFNELLDRIESSFERTRQFVADASHELRTPVAVIRSEADVALTPPLSETEAFEALDVIRDESGRLTKLVDDMFTLVRADAGDVTDYATDTIRLEDLVASCARRAESLGWSRGVSVVLRTVTHGEATCSGDRSKLDRMLANLVDNATKYTPRGGHVWIDSLMTRYEGRPAVAISVTDDGPGIAPEHRDKVFERFYCVDRARTREKGGSGLGLPIARWIAWSHGGTLTLDVGETGGCAFTAVLPVRFQEAGGGGDESVGHRASSSMTDTHQTTYSSSST